VYTGGVKRGERLGGLKKPHTRKTEREILLIINCDYFTFFFFFFFHHLHLLLFEIVNRTYIDKFQITKN